MTNLKSISKTTLMACLLVSSILLGIDRDAFSQGTDADIRADKWHKPIEHSSTARSDDERTKQIVDNRVNWSDFLNRHDIIWEILPEKFDHGSFHGNGLLGTMIYKDAGNRLRWEIGRSDVTAHRRDNNRLPIGGLGLETVGDIQSGTIRLGLYNAESTGELVTTKGSIEFRTFIHAEEMVVVIEIQCTGSEKDAKFKWLPAKCVDGVNGKRFSDDKPNPPHQSIKDSEVSLCVQPRAAGGEFATAWTESVVKDGMRRVFLSAADTFPGNGAGRQATGAVRNAVKADFGQLLKSHRQWWHDYYPKSFVSVPDARVEGFYWAQMYKLACATRQDRMVIDLLGPWFRHTGWPRIWWNLNLQIAYSPVYTSNHLELGDSLIRMLDRNRDNFARNALELYGVKDGATVPHTTCYEGLRGNGSRAPDEYINPADFTWALHNYWLQYRYSMDRSLITDHDKHAFYPLLRGSINVYLHILKLGEDGRYHLGVLMSPEYAKVADNNYNLSMLRWGCQTLLDICKEHDMKDPLSDEWQKVLDLLVDYPVDETGFMIGANMPLERSHRHWQHLQMVFPLYQLDFDDAEQRELIEKSILHWQNIQNGKQIFGWSDAAASCLYSVLQDGNNAYKHLIRHHKNKRFVMPNTMYIEGDPVIECSFFAAKSLQEMLLQSWGRTIRVFPSVPDVWKDIVFNDLRTEGAFLVSASRKEGNCQWVRIKSLAGESCRVIPGLSGEIRAKDQSGKSVSIAELGKGVIQIDIKKGQEVLLYNTRKVPQAVVAPLALDIESHNYWGVKSLTDQTATSITTSPPTTPTQQFKKNAKFPVKQSTWHDYDKFDFKYDSRTCYVITPQTQLPHRPWIWRARFFGHEPQADLALLAKGYHLVYMDVADLFGSPAAVAHWNAFYDYLTTNHKFNPPVALEGMSRGGLIIYNWAAANPDKVACIYGDNPVCDFKSWPGGKGKSKGHNPSWQTCLKAYNLTEEQGLAYGHNPIDNLKPLARAAVPILHVCGTADTTVPMAENSDLIESRYKKLGGKITVIRKPGLDHHPHSLKDPAPIVNFILKYTAADYDKFQAPLRGGLKNCQIIFQQKKKGRVAFLGGSITTMDGWRNHVCDYLQQRFPDTQFDFIAAGIPSTGSVPGAFRLTRDVFNNGPVDLLFEEAAVNDETNARPNTAQVRGMEGIVRHARLLNPNMDIILMHFVDPGKMNIYNSGKVPVVIANHEKVATHYKLPSLNLALEVTQRIAAGQFDWENDFRNLHPSPFGQNIYFRAMHHLMENAWRSPLPPNAQPTPNPMPAEPLDQFSYYRGEFMKIDQAELINGFTLDPAWKPKDKTGTRPGFVNVPMLTADQPDSTLKLSFTGTAIGLFVAAGNDAGIIEFSIDAGPPQRLDQFTPWSHGLHLPWAYILSDELTPGAHQLILKTTGDKNPRSKGHACRIVHFLTN